MCTINDTKLTTSIIVAVSGSIRKPIDSFRFPDCSHV
jgi:hypothetical protein